MTSLLGKSAADLRMLMSGWGEPAFRGDQLYSAIYRERLTDLAAIPTLPHPLRKQLAESYSAGHPEVAARFESTDGTVRYLLRLEDGRTVECVLMPEDGTET